jgi:hypothetical protein
VLNSETLFFFAVFSKVIPRQKVNQMNEWGNNPATYQAIGAIFSSIGIIAIFIAWQSLKESKAQRLAIQDEMAARRRPWVGLFGCDFILPVEGGSGLDELHLLLRNFGTLPAQNAFLTIMIIPLRIDNYEPSDRIVSEEKGGKVLLPDEEGNYKINLSNYPQFLTWKEERRDLRVEGNFLYKLSNREFSSVFECVLRYGIVNSKNKQFKINWRNIEVI